MGDFKTTKPKNFLGVKDLWSDIVEIPKYFKILLGIAIIVILFFNFFDVQGASHGGGANWFTPIQQYNTAFCDNGSTFGPKGQVGQAVAVAILYSLNGLASFTGILALAMIIQQRTSQFFWGIINALFFGLFSISVGYLGNMLMQCILILGAPIGWYMFEIKGMADRQETKKGWKYNFALFTYVAIVIAGIVLVLYEFLPSAFNDTFGKTGASNPYLGQSSSATKPNVTRVMDSLTNGFNVVGYVFQLMNSPQQFFIWIFVDILKILSFTGIAGTKTLSVNMLIEFLVWTSIASYGLYDRNVKPFIENLIHRNDD